MPIENKFLHRKLKKISWGNRESWLSENPNEKLISPYKINNSLQKPVDWEKISENCSKNPKHEHFGKDPKVIRELWKNKSKRGKNNGNTLDDYITKKLKGVVDTSDYSNSIIEKTKQFDNLYDNFIKKLKTYVGSEIWLNSKRLGIIARLDSLFTIKDDKSLLICEWKNTENITTNNRFENLLGAASNLNNSEINKYTIQVYIYKYILEEYGLFDIVKPYIYQFSTENDNYKIYKPSFEYDPKFIEEITKQSRNER